MTRLTPFLAALLATGLQGVAPCRADAAEAPRVAVVIGNASYPGLPPLPACAASARAMADALEALGFDVVRAENVGNGDSGAQLARLDVRLRAGVSPGAAAPVPGATVVVYLCGYARSLDGRRFLLPVDARIDRPTDLLAQGVLPHSFVRVASMAGATGGALLLDVFAVPGEAGAVDRAGTAAADGSFGLATVAHPAPEAGAAASATPLAAAAAAALSAPGADTGSIIAAIQASAGTGGATLSASLPSAPTPLAPAVAAPAVPLPAPTLSTVPDTSPAPPAAAAAPAEAPYDVSTPGGRRAVQQDLVRLGYYAGPVDGIFGSDTTAAIRRLQHELGDPLTGSPSPAEIAALQVRAVSGRIHGDRRASWD